MPFCEKCGAKMEEEAKFCPSCGAGVKRTAVPVFAAEYAVGEFPGDH